jgi:Pyruvate/2-oxoacid:ferredoxin oxidoreductase delta subunit
MDHTDGTTEDLTAALRGVAVAVGAPDFILPWLDRFYDADDAELIAAVAQSGDEAGEAATPGDGDLAGVDAARLERAVGRAVLDVDEAGAYTPASFADRLDIWAMFEGWGDVPGEVRAQLADWATDDYAGSVRDDLEALKAGVPRATREVDYTYLLLSEAEAVIAAEPRVYLWPCDCRAIVGTCDQPVDVCLRFENERGRGREISREEAVRILRETDAAGLTHTDYLGRSAGDLHAICNCCTDCCFPHRAAARLGAEAVWPRRRHLAVVDAGACTGCGTCEERCPFAAIAVAGDATGSGAIVAAGSGADVAAVEAAECRGCGLCATGCSSDAIEMQPLTTAG